MRTAGNEKPTVLNTVASSSSHIQLESGRFRRYDPRSDQVNDNGSHDSQSKSDRDRRLERVDRVKRQIIVIVLCIQSASFGFCIQSFRNMGHERDWSRKSYYIVFSLALTGSLCLIDNSSEIRVSKRLMHHYLLVVVYFVALIVTLSSSILKGSSRGIELAKSICGIVGWCVSCFQIYQTTKGSRRAEQSLNSN